MPRYVVLQENGVESDPLSGSEVLRWVREGRIQPSTMIRGAASRRWYQAKDIEAIAVILPLTSTQPSTEEVETIPLADHDTDHSAFIVDESGSHSEPRKPPAVAEPTIAHSAQQATIPVATTPSSTLGPNRAQLFDAGRWLQWTLTFVGVVTPLLCRIAASLAILYFSGWRLFIGPDGLLAHMKSVLGSKYSTTWELRLPDFLKRINDLGTTGCFLDIYGFGFAFTDSLYAVGLTDRFFFSPVLQWICFAVAIGILFPVFRLFKDDE